MDNDVNEATMTGEKTARRGEGVRMERESDVYRPVDCALHDELLARATLRRPVELGYLDERCEERTVRDRIVDVFARDRAEFLKLENGLEIRLDKLTRIDGEAVR